MDKKITASEIAGELRKVSRLYEVFKAADEMAAVVVNLEQMERQVKKDIETAKVELAGVNKAIMDVQVRSKREKDAATLEAKQLREEAAIARAQASEVLRKARDEGAAAVASAKAEVAALKVSIDMCKKEEQGLKMVIAGLEKAKDVMVAEMQAKRDQLLKAFS